MVKKFNMSFEIVEDGKRISIFWKENWRTSTNLKDQKIDAREMAVKPKYHKLINQQKHNPQLRKDLKKKQKKIFIPQNKNSFRSC
jgi:hypothetical protein